MSKEFRWAEATSSAYGYPIDVYMGGLQSADGDFTSLYSGTTHGEWGSANSGMRDGIRTIPNHLHVIWVSYVEGVFYEIDTPIDYDKMVSLFREGYYIPSLDKDYPEPRKEEYKKIITGFAPGGVVVIWLEGAGRQIEIGRYQGKKVTISQEQIDALPVGPKKNMFNPEYQRKILYEFDIVPKEVAEANRNKPIPFGIWDTYRERYNWSIEFELPNNGKIIEIDYFLFNGELETLFGDTELEKYDVPINLQWKNLTKRTIPNKIYFSWEEKPNKLFEGTIKYNEEEILSAFNRVFKHKQEGKAELIIRVNESKNYASIVLKGNDEEVWLINNEIVITD